MGVDYSAYIVVGVTLGELGFEDLSKEEEVTRYDSITGKPFQLKTLKHSCRIGNLEISGVKLMNVLKMLASGELDDYEDDLNESASASLNTIVKLLGVFTPSYLDDTIELDTDCVIGVYVKCVNDYRNLTNSIDVGSINEIALEASEKLNDIFGYAGEVKVYIQMRVSC